MSPMMRWPLGEHGDVVDRFTRCFAYFLEEVLELGVVWEVGDANGAAVWVPPGRSEAWEGDPWNQPRIGALTDDAGARYDSFWEWVDSRHPDEPLWRLDSTAVERAAQGRRFGAALIAAGLAQAREDGVGAFLSTGTSSECRHLWALRFPRRREARRAGRRSTDLVYALGPVRRTASALAALAVVCRVRAGPGCGAA
jgi:GNAT superfamily N-acetyltransferase